MPNYVVTQQLKFTSRVTRTVAAKSVAEACNVALHEAFCGERWACGRPDLTEAMIVTMTELPDPPDGA